MLEQDLKESRLQQWFSAVAADRDIMSNIQSASLAEFQRRCAIVQSDRRQTTRLRRGGLLRAKKICNLLLESDLVTENKNIARVADTRMHPDLVLISQAGNYMLVELKTQRNAERQGVQELLAYYAALRQQMPYANEFIFIVVAVHWDELLTQAVKALVLDGKHVLPLRVHPGAAVEFSLSIELPVFEFNLEQVYDPLRALMPAEFGINIPYQPWTLKIGALTSYLQRMMQGSVASARQRGLSGFCLRWSHQTGYGIYHAILLVTVNQHWQYHADYDVNTVPDTYTPDGLERAVDRDSRKVRAQFLKGKDPTDVFTTVDANSIGNEAYKQSYIAYEILDGLRRVEEESGQQFELGGAWSSIKHLLNQRQNQYWAIHSFFTFGEFSDFMVPLDAEVTPRHNNALYELLHLFHDYKQRDQVTGGIDVRN